MYFLHKAFAGIAGTEYTLRAANYLLGTHPISSTSCISSVGTSSKLLAYGNNRADNTFIPGGVIPRYIVIKPDFPESIDDFGFLWFEDEYVIAVATKYIEWLALGAVALRVPGKLLWDARNMRFTNNQEANKYLKPFLRKGWEFKL